jgi:SAM-dependent methyltransferase
VKKHLRLTGSVTFVHDVAPGMGPVDIVERGQLRKLGGFVPLNGYAPIALPAQSDDLVSGFVGLHHMAPSRLMPFLESIARITRPGGYFIVRDHDVKTPAMDAFVSLAHTVFNASLGESWETNRNELRHFASIEDWIARIETVGFLTPTRGSRRRATRPTICCSRSCAMGIGNEAPHRTRAGRAVRDVARDRARVGRRAGCRQPRAARGPARHRADSADVP